jgi:hypothetical protein
MTTDVVEESLVFRAEKQGVVQTVEFFFFFSVMNLEAIFIFEKSLRNYQTAQSHTPQNRRKESSGSHNFRAL